MPGKCQDASLLLVLITVTSCSTPRDKALKSSLLNRTIPGFSCLLVAPKISKKPFPKCARGGVHFIKEDRTRTASLSMQAIRIQHSREPTATWLKEIHEDFLNRRVPFFISSTRKFQSTHSSGWNYHDISAPFRIEGALIDSRAQSWIRHHFSKPVAGIMYAPFKHLGRKEAEITARNEVFERLAAIKIRNAGYDSPLEEFSGFQSITFSIDTLAVMHNEKEPINIVKIINNFTKQALPYYAKDDNKTLPGINKMLINDRRLRKVFAKIIIRKVRDSFKKTRKSSLRVFWQKRSTRGEIIPTPFLKI